MIDLRSQSRDVQVPDVGRSRPEPALVNEIKYAARSQILEFAIPNTYYLLVQY
jgi:hypothetical protein